MAHIFNSVITVKIFKLHSNITALNIRAKIKKEYIDARSYGYRITLRAECERSILKASYLGERGKRAESIGANAANKLIKELKNNASLDMYVGWDQIVPYLAFAGGETKISRITEYARINVRVVNQFGFSLKIDEDQGGIG